jgi:hypothetical protein
MKTSKNELKNVAAQAWTLAAAGNNKINYDISKFANGIYLAHFINNESYLKNKFIVHK